MHALVTSRPQLNFLSCLNFNRRTLGSRYIQTRRKSPLILRHTKHQSKRKTEKLKTTISFFCQYWRSKALQLFVVGEVAITAAANGLLKEKGTIHTIRFDTLQSRNCRQIVFEISLIQPIHTECCHNILTR